MVDSCITHVSTSGIPQSLSGKCGGFRRSMINFLGIVRFVPATPTFHGSIYGILTFSLLSMSFFFFFLSTSVSIYDILEFQSRTSICFPSYFIIVFFYYFI